MDNLNYKYLYNLQDEVLKLVFQVENAVED